MGLFGDSDAERRAKDAARIKAASQTDVPLYKDAESKAAWAEVDQKRSMGQRNEADAAPKKSIKAAGVEGMRAGGRVKAKGVGIARKGHGKGTIR